MELRSPRTCRGRAACARGSRARESYARVAAVREDDDGERLLPSSSLQIAGTRGRGRCRGSPWTSRPGGRWPVAVLMASGGDCVLGPAVEDGEASGSGGGNRRDPGAGWLLGFVPG